MNGTILRSFVNSVNNVTPDSNGNVTVSFPVTSVNGQTGATVVEQIWYGSNYSIGPINEDTFISIANWRCTSDPYNREVNALVLYANRENGHLMLRREKKDGSIIDAYCYSEVNQPPYPVTAVNGYTGSVDLRIVRGTLWNSVDNDAGTGWHSLDYAAGGRGNIRHFNGSGWSTPSAAVTNYATNSLWAPDGSWWQHLYLIHPNYNGYYTDIQVGINTSDLFYHRVTGGGSGGEVRIWDAAHFSCALSGTTLTINYIS